MKIKLDENLPDRLVAALTALGHDVDTVYAERLNGQIDPRVWSATQAAERFLITQDLDFSDVRRYTPGTHAGLLLVRLARPSGDALFERGHGIPNRECRGLGWMSCGRDRPKGPRQTTSATNRTLSGSLILSVARHELLQRTT